jgi:glutathione peroxidase
MKKYCFVLIGSFFSLLAVQSSLYDIQIQTIDGNTMNLSAYQGKKIILVEFDAVNPDTGQLQWLDSIQTGYDSVIVIAIPAIDFSGTGNEESLRMLHDSLGLHIQFTMPEAVKKTAGSGQDPLFKWLTDVNENGHFDNEVEQPGQLYIIGNQGTLYSLLTKDTPHEIITGALSQHIIE